MPPMWSLLSQINPFRFTWALQLRLVRAYEIPAYGKNNEIKDYVCIFHDREGVRIQATIQLDLVDRFKSSLIEGNIYALKNVSVINIFGVVGGVSGIQNTICNGRETKLIEFWLEDLDVTANTIGAISTSSTMNMVGNLEHEDVKNISEITENNLIGSFWVYGKIVAIESVGSWYYLSCKKCSKKIIKVESGFYCERCKVKMEVGEYRGDASFLLWNRECVQLIGKSAEMLRSGVVEGGQNTEIPDEIESLVDKEALFKILIKPDQKINYSVLKIWSDETVTSKYCLKYKESEERDYISILDNDDTLTEKVASSEASIITPKKVPEDLLEESSVKRSLFDDFSSTVPTKKTKVVVKIEKEEH
ncbi:hypothetical protein C2S51_007568 [Perilla frutescens var. frutescens]|nr:hypothetical protein C2S51_007568 [Perilla frutescens var. frutescens]